ncbi:DUF3726 domain-containing protein [Ruegeria arenilitoris]|uniref:DUF3726 domain-containing protein n=1 Tax=Ruegeria arenilitoris TaxID=1173585 RepID=UPI00147CB1B1
MNLSLNEVEATAKRAARGAGYSWGLAEEAGKASRWLCTNGLDGVSALTRLLELGLAPSASEHAPTRQQERWSCESILCPLVTGALLSDSASRLLDGQIDTSPIAIPEILLPFAANASLVVSNCVSVDIDGEIAITDGKQLLSVESYPDVAARVTIQLGGDLNRPTCSQTRATPDRAIWNRLNQFAQRTYAPATEESRQLGAGAGLTDND